MSESKTCTSALSIPQARLKASAGLFDEQPQSLIPNSLLETSTRTSPDPAAKRSRHMRTVPVVFVPTFTDPMKDSRELFAAAL